MDELLKGRRMDDPFILAGGNKTKRQNLVKREFAAWMRGYGWTRRETAHALRKYRGHMWKKAHDWLRHANWQTTLDYYADIKNDYAPLAVS
jgi:integrase